jgi:hypothetical protein
MPHLSGLAQSATGHRDGEIAQARRMAFPIGTGRRQRMFAQQHPRRRFTRLGLGDPFSPGDLIHLLPPPPPALPAPPPVCMPPKPPV